MTQKERVLLHLQVQGSICVDSVPRDLGYTLRNRISELRASGVAIESERCTRHSHASTVSRYFLAERAPASRVTDAKALQKTESGVSSLLGQSVGGAVSNTTPVQMAIAL